MCVRFHELRGVKHNTLKQVEVKFQIPAEQMNTQDALAQKHCHAWQEQFHHHHLLLRLIISWA